MSPSCTANSTLCFREHSQGLAGTSNGVIRIHHDGSWTQVADLSAFQQAHPTANPEPDDFEPDGTWYSMVAVDGVLYAIEANHGELDAITPSGRIRRVSDISLIQGHIVPQSPTTGRTFLSATSTRSLSRTDR
jgi:hypothetical protein